MLTDITQEEYEAIGHNPGDPFGELAPWEIATKVTALRETRVGPQQEETGPAEEGSEYPEGEELAKILAEVYGPETEQTEKPTPTVLVPVSSEAIGRNGLVLIDDSDWVDMTARNMDYMRHVYRSDLNHADKSVLGVVALHCGINSRGCTASNETLAEEANIDKDNFRKRISRLTKEGWVRENGMLPAVRPGMSGTKIRHIGVKRSWIEGGS
jgi:DNA-binding Lrp family transcriptional regulator